MGSNSSPEYTLRECTASDVPAMIPVYHSAFAQDLVSSYTFPRDVITPEEWQRWLMTRFTGVFSKAECRTFAVFHSASNEMVAFCRWSFPHTLTPAEKAQREADAKEKEEADKRENRDTTWPIGSNREVCDLKFLPIKDFRKKYVNGQETYTVDLIGVSQAHQRKGIASMLLEHVLQKADAEGRKAYLEATDAGWFVYKKLGFEDVDQVEIDLRKWGADVIGYNRIMIREPKVPHV